MKRTTSMIAAALLLCLSTAALAAPGEIHTQGVLRDANGDLMAGELELVFGIYDSAADGQLLWQESVTVVLIGGVFDTMLPADPEGFPFPEGLFDADDRWLAITPADQDELPRTRLSSVPYALQAELARDLQCSGCIASDEVDFNYASSDAPGGAATTALLANEALVAGNVSCDGCVTLQAIDAAVLTAVNVAYDNILSGLAAATVQDALDETALVIDDHINDATVHGGAGSGGDAEAKVRVVANDVTVVSGQVATEYLYVFSADTPKVYFYAHGRAATEGDDAEPASSGGTVIYTRCPWVGSHGKATSTCTPTACPEGWTDLGVLGNVMAGGNATGEDYSISISTTSQTAAYGFQERACYRAESVVVVQPRCPWIGSHGKSVGTCTPPACPEDWADLGVTGNVMAGGAATGEDYSISITTTSQTASYGHQERTCVKIVPSQIPQGVEIWIDGEDRTAAIGDQQGKGAPAWTGSSWGADGTTPWATGRLDLSQAIDWGVGEHVLQFKNTGESGGKIQYHVYFVDPAAASQSFPNDTCDGAAALVFEGGVATVNGTTEDMLGENKALDDLSPAGCGGEGGPDVVYAATLTERTTIHASVAAPFATRLHILDSPCQAEAVLACGADQATTLELDPGTYYIVVDSTDASQTGDFSLTVELEASPMPINDTCATAPAIAAGPELLQVTGTTKWGLDQYSGTCGGDGAADVVYSFEATDVNDDLSVTISAPFAPVMFIRAQSCEGGFQMACSATGALSIPGLAPGTYYLFVDGVTGDDEGAFTLDVTLN